MRTKLSTYLAKRKISHRAFAAAAGIPHLHPMVSQWAAGRRVPGLDCALAIEDATRGEVPASYWRDIRPRLVRRSRRQASPQTS